MSSCRHVHSVNNCHLSMNVVTQLTQFVGRDVINKNTTDLAVHCSTGSVELSFKQSWKYETQYTVATVATSESHSVITLFDVTMRDAPSHVWKLFFYIGNCNILNLRGRDRRCRTAEADEMQTQNSEIHTSLVTIRRGKMMHYDASPNAVARNNPVWPEVQNVDWEISPWAAG